MDHKQIVLQLLCMLCSVIFTLGLGDLKECSSQQGKKSLVPIQLKLPQQYEATMEVKNTKALQEGTFMVREYSDSLQKRGAKYDSSGSQVTSWLYDYKQYRSYKIDNTGCNALLFKGEIEDIEAFLSRLQHGKSERLDHIYKIFGKKKFEVIANETVRDIQVEHQKLCVEVDGKEITLDVYMRLTGTDVDKKFPIKIALSGTNFHTSYDIIFFNEDPVFDEKVFEVPSGVVCTPDSLFRTPPPFLPDMFSVSMEMIFEPFVNSTAMPSYSHIVYDFEHKLVKADRFIPNPKINKHARRIYDFNTGHLYQMTDEGTCNITRIPPDDPFAGHANGDPNTVNQRHGYNLNDIDLKTFQYQGKRTLRGISVDTWAQEVKNGSAIRITEVYFTSLGHTLAGMRIMDKRDNNLELDTMLHFFNVDKRAPDIEVFNVFSCVPYSKLENLWFGLKIPGNYEKQPNWEHEMKIAVRQSVVEVTKIEPIRVGVTMVVKSMSHVDVNVQFLPKSDGKGNVDHPVFEMAAVDALLELDLAIEQNTFFVDLKSHNGAKLKLAPTKPSKSTKKSNGPVYSSGSMAALGIIMTILGIIGGLAIAYVLYKREVRVPYLIQE